MTNNSTASQAADVRKRAMEAGRWYGRYLVVLGIVSAAWIVALETAFDDGLARVLAAIAWAAFIVGASQWAERRPAFPVGATRRLRLAVATWFVLYALVAGPLVRWQFDDSLPAWILASIAMASPFFIAAARR